MDIEQVEDPTTVLISSEKDSKGKTKICYDKKWEDHVKVCAYNFKKQLHATLAQLFIYPSSTGL